MHILLRQQYQLVRSARGALFDYCQAICTEDLLKPLPAFNNECIISQLTHIANCYVFWLAHAAMKQQRPFFTGAEIQHFDALRDIYKEVDRLMEAFLEHFSGSPG